MNIKLLRTILQFSNELITSENILVTVDLHTSSSFLLRREGTENNKGYRRRE